MLLSCSGGETRCGGEIGDDKMDMDVFDYLNKIYLPLWEKYNELCKGLKEAGLKIAGGFFNNHSVKHNNTFITEYFPIPVILMDNLGDVGIDIDSIWLEIKLSRAIALNLDYTQLASKYLFEVYGAENYLSDIYNEQINVSDIVSNIQRSEETTFCICFYFDEEVNVNELLNAISIFRV
jgi:hypothetical protein